MHRKSVRLIRILTYTKHLNVLIKAPLWRFFTNNGNNGSFSEKGKAFWKQVQHESIFGSILVDRLRSCERFSFLVFWRCRVWFQETKLWSLFVRKQTNGSLKHHRTFSARLRKDFEEQLKVRRSLAVKWYSTRSWLVLVGTWRIWMVFPSHIGWKRRFFQVTWYHKDSLQDHGCFLWKDPKI